MLLDERAEFLDATATNGNGVSQLVGDVLDTQLPANNLNTLTSLDTGEPVYLVITCDTSASGGTSIELQLRSSSTADLATSPVTHTTTGAVLVANFVAAAANGTGGYTFVVEL